MIKNEKDIVIYLSGPIDNCSYEETHGWREKIRSLWKGKVLDPCRRNVDLNQVKEIVTLDLLDIGAADVTLANCWKTGWGTAMEIPYAFNHHKLVGIIWPPNGRHISPWIQYHSHFVRFDIESALETIRYHFRG